MAGNQGLNSDNMSQSKKDEIHRLGGQASHTGGNTNRSNSSDVTTNRSGGGRLTQADKSKGGKASHGGNS